MIQSTEVRMSPIISGWLGGDGWMEVAVVVGHNLQLRVLSHSTCESLMGGLEGGGGGRGGGVDRVNEAC